MVATGTVLLGAGVGVLGSTVNPFAVGVAIDAPTKAGASVNNGKVIFLGLVLWFSSLIVAIMFVMNYAKKIKKDKDL